MGTLKSVTIQIDIDELALMCSELDSSARLLNVQAELARDAGMEQKAWELIYKAEKLESIARRFAALGRPLPLSLV